MSHLLVISVGPVQEFIAAARRTRDLWFGSHLLSEISKAVAKSVRVGGGELIFPHPASELEPDSHVNVANVILAELPAGDPKAIAEAAKAAAQNRWLDFVADAWQKVHSVLRPGVWENQLSDVIEFYSAWVPGTQDYRTDRARVMRLLAGRKNCRDFAQPGFKDGGLPKSSLDGQRPTVLVGPKQGESRETYRENWPPEVRLSLRLSPGEQLDVVGVTKRLGKKRGERFPSYPSVARVAAETWLRGVKDKADFDKLRSACAVVPRLNQVAEPKYNYFPYEGTVIFKDRHPDLIRELGEEVREPLKQVAEALERLGGEPNPYLAVLAADGDSMGAKLSTITSAEDHRTFSENLADFASAAQAILSEYCGVLIYAGGDDVLALVPLRTCLRCAGELGDEFKRRTGMTLSVGLAIGHFMESLEDLLAYARAAEKAAKRIERKNALAVHLHKRGGAPIGVRAKWTDELDDRLSCYARLILSEAIPSKLPYDLRNLADLYKGWRCETMAEKRAAVEAMRKDVLRVIRGKQPRSGRQQMTDIEKILTGLDSAEGLQHFAEELLVARQIAAALRQAGERPAQIEETVPCP